MTKDQSDAVAANAIEVATWASRKAAALDVLIEVSEVRPLSPAETRRVLVDVRELYVRISQQQVFLVEMGFHWHAPWWVWARTWLWGYRRGVRR